MHQFLPIKNLAIYYHHHVMPIEIMVMEHLCSLQRVCWLKVLFIAFSRLGDGYLWLVTGSFLFITGNQEVQTGVFISAIAVMVAVAVFMVLKKMIGRPRPFETMQNLKCIIAAPDQFSFPSGHTMTAFSAWASLSSVIPELFIPYLLIAMMIGLSRVFLGLHYPTDVIVGAVLGSVIGIFVKQAYCTLLT